MTNGELIAVKIVTLQRANLMTFRVIGSQRKVAKLVETGNLGYVRTLVSTLLKLTNPVHFLAKKENKDLYSAEPRKCVCDHKSLLESVGEIFQENLLLGFYELVIKVMKSLYFFFSSSLQSWGDLEETMWRPQYQLPEVKNLLFKLILVLIFSSGTILESCLFPSRKVFQRLVTNKSYLCCFKRVSWEQMGFCKFDIFLTFCWHADKSI